mmetsp:Transcript_100349/g.244093  ORF Transcript_100349/g.244093 Transcript_100349/m.244093 type:complete len:127 (-) Transcript_100349:541-921(-)
MTQWRASTIFVHLWGNRKVANGNAAKDYCMEIALRVLMAFACLACEVRALAIVTRSAQSEIEALKCYLNSGLKSCAMEKNVFTCACVNLSALILHQGSWQRQLCGINSDAILQQITLDLLPMVAIL